MTLIGIFACGPWVMAEAPSYTQVVSNKLAPLLQKCVKHIESEMPKFHGTDTFVFKILPSGKAQGFSYKSEEGNAIPKAWLNCARGKINGASFPRPPGRKAYVHNGTMTWNMSTTELNPHVPPTFRAKIHAALAGKVTDFQACYTKYVEKGGLAEGNVVLLFNITSEGKISTPRLNIDEIHDAKFAACLTDALKTLRFPGMSFRESIPDISHPLLFKRP